MRPLPRLLPRVSNFLRAWAEGAVRWERKGETSGKRNESRRQTHSRLAPARPIMADPPIMARESLQCRWSDLLFAVVVNAAAISGRLRAG
jgi:hypothetical protein